MAFLVNGSPIKVQLHCRGPTGKVSRMRVGGALFIVYLNNIEDLTRLQVEGLLVVYKILRCACQVQDWRYWMFSKSSAARAALRSTRLLLHLFRASEACNVGARPPLLIRHDIEVGGQGPRANGSGIIGPKQV